MILENHSERGVDIVTLLTDRIVMANVKEVSEALILVVNEGSGKIVLDVSSVLFQDSSGLDLVAIRAVQAARKRGGDIYLTGLTHGIRALFELTRLDTVIHIFDSVDSAMDAMAAKYPVPDGGTSYPSFD